MASNQGLYTVLILKNMGFPYGMAAIQAVRLIAKSLLESGTRVKVFVVTAGDLQTGNLNDKISGIFEGIHFEYTTGKTFRGDSFLERRWLGLKGVTMALLNLWSLKKENPNMCLYLYGFSQEPNLSKFAITSIANLLHIPVALEICETPWTLGDKRKNVLRNLNLLSGISGVIVISKFLEDWCQKEAQRKNYKIKILRRHILTELSEYCLKETNITDHPSVLFASSSAYDETVEFIIRSMQLVWEKIPDCDLIITGSMKHQQKVKECLANADQYQSKVKVTGYIPREELFRLYKRSWALLIPLFNDVRSIARFPTKIGEYLSTARPIVTTNVGEIPSFFADGINAFVSQEDTAQAFGSKILEALLNPERAAIIGNAGLDTCRETFEYSKHSNEFLEFFAGLGKD